MEQYIQSKILLPLRTIRYSNMRTVTFNITKLGAIRDSKIELKPLMLFSGESGLGKSYAAFLIHYLYVLLINSRIKNYFIENNVDFTSVFSTKKSGEVLFKLSVKELFSWINKDAISYIGYMIGHENFTGDVKIDFACENEYFEFIFEDEIVGLDNHEDVFYKIILNDFTYRILANSFEPSSTPFADLISAVLLDEIFGNYTAIKRTYLMPPSRGALMELAERPSFRSGMYDEFFDFKVALNRPLPKPATIDPIISACLQEVNNGNLQQVEDRIMYYTNNGDSMPLTAAASSIKEMAPFTLMLNKFSAKGISILFEEPEAHLHPDRQVKVADLIACALNQGCHMQITTHSDYFIKRINNLMKLYQLREKTHPEIFTGLLMKKHIKDDCLIDPAQVGAYLLKRMDDGTSRIMAQDVLAKDEIPFESFYQVIEDDIELSREIRKLLQ